MAGFKGTGASNATLDAWLGSTVLGPATVYVALFTAAPAAGGGGTELAMTGYARVAVTNNATNFPAASSATKNNGTLIDFGTLTGTGATITWAAVVKTSSGALSTSDIIYAGPLSVARAIVSGDSFDFPIGAATFTEA